MDGDDDQDGAVLLYPGIPSYGYCPRCGTQSHATIRMYVWHMDHGAEYIGTYSDCIECDVVVE